MPSDWEENFANDFMQHLIESGYIYEVGQDENGEALYQTTEEFREAYPEMFAEQIAETNQTINELWMLGLVDVTVSEETNDWVVIPNKKTMRCDVKELTSDQRNIITQLRYRILLEDYGKIED